MAFSNVKRLKIGFLCLPLLGGCATQTDEQTKQLRELSDRIARMQSSNDRLEERVAALETAHRTPIKRQTEARSPAAPPTDLPIVKMSPPAAATPNDALGSGTDTDEPRTLIVGEGSRVEARNADEPLSNLPVRRGKDKTTEPQSKKASGTSETGNKKP